MGEKLNFKNKTVLVTGGAGFIGSHLVDTLLSQDAEKVTVIDNLVGSQGSDRNIAHLKKNESFEFIQGSISNQKLMDSVVAGKDIVFNLAASKLVVSLKDPAMDIQTNVLGNFYVMDAATRHNALLVHASTGSVFGSSNKLFKEDSPKNPSTIYGLSKLATENNIFYCIRENGLKASIVRYFHVYGPRQDYFGDAGVVSIFLSKALTGSNPIVYGSGEQIRCFTFVSDDVFGTLLLAKKKKALGQSFNIASKERISVKELANQVVERFGVPPSKVEFGPPRKGENLKPIPDTSAIEALGFKAKVSFNQGLEITKNWLVQDMKSRNEL